MIALITAIAGLVGSVLQEYFSAKARARAANEKFQLDDTTFQLLVLLVLTNRQANASGNSAGAGKAWDEGDKK